MTNAQHLARASRHFHLAANLLASSSGSLSVARITRKVRGAARLQKWAHDHLHAAGGWEFESALADEHDAWCDRLDRRDAAKAKHALRRAA